MCYTDIILEELKAYMLSTLRKWPAGLTWKHSLRLDRLMFGYHSVPFDGATLISSSYQSPTMPNFPIWLRSAVYTELIILVQSAFMGRIYFRRFALPRLEPAFSHGAGSNSLENLPITDGRSTFCFNLNCCVLGMGKQIECCPWSIPPADS